MSRFFKLASLLLAATQVVAQTYTSCNPTNSTECPSDMALGTSHTWHWNTTTAASTSVWNTTAGTVDWTTEGAQFTINEKGDSPTIQSVFYIFFGQVSVIMKAANGTGIVSSIVLESDDLDEIDWEFLGGNDTSVETNYFGKGNTTSYDRAIYYDVNDVQDTWHNYTLDWTSDRLEWIIDGTVVRTLNYSDANSGKNYPQTPMTVRLGIWAGGDTSANSEGTVEWAGGNTTYKNTPYIMSVKSLYVEDYSVGKSYTYGNTSGDWESINITSGNSTVYKILNESSSVSKTIKEKFNGLPKWAKIAIAAGSCGAVAILVIAAAVFCIMARRSGRRERIAQDAEWEKHEMELAQYKQRMREDADDQVPLRGYNPNNVHGSQF